MEVAQRRTPEGEKRRVYIKVPVFGETKMGGRPDGYKTATIAKFPFVLNVVYRKEGNTVTIAGDWQGSSDLKTYSMGWGFYDLVTPITNRFMQQIVIEQLRKQGVITEGTKIEFLKGDSQPVRVKQGSPPIALVVEALTSVLRGLS